MSSIGPWPISRAAVRIDSTIYGIWYHLGIVQYVRGEFAAAAASFAKAQPIAPDPGELAGSTDWLWMSLSRAGRGAEAKAMLDRRPDITRTAHHQRLHAPPAALSRRDRPGCRAHAGGHRRRSDRDARLRPRQLVSRPGRQGEGARVVRTIGSVGRMAGVRVHSLGSGTRPGSLSGSGTHAEITRGRLAKRFAAPASHRHGLDGGRGAQRPSTSLGASGERDWPPITAETKPWTRWWWQGSAVERRSLTADLEALAAAGIGGVEVTPIYGVRGAEDRFLPYLSSPWMAMLDHTLREATRLKMGVDMATGTGWPFGGPWVGDDTAPRSLVHRTWTLAAGERLAEPVTLRQTPLVRALGNQIHVVNEGAPGDPPRGAAPSAPVVRPEARALTIGDLAEPVSANKNLQALALEQVKYPRDLPLAVLMAYSEAGDTIDLTSRVQADGRLDWTAPRGPLDAACALRRLARQAGRARRARR